MKATETSKESQGAARRRLNRRLWLQSACGAGLATLVFSQQLAIFAQDRRMVEAAKAMSIMTGVELPEQWLHPTASLVGVILDYSKVLRELDLGELEPATLFVAR